MTNKERFQMYMAVLFGLLIFQAQSATGQTTDIFVGPQIGLLGLGGSAEVDFGVASVSAEFGYIPISQVNLDEEDLQYDINTDFYGGIFLVNVGPQNSRFSVGAGLLLGGYNASGAATDLTDEIDIGDNTYDAADVGDIEAAIDYSGPAPAIMLGFRGKGFNVGIGVAFTGSPGFDLSTTGPLQIAQLQEDLEMERQSVQDELDILPVLPLLRIGWQFGL